MTRRRSDDDRKTRRIAFAAVPPMDEALAKAAGVTPERVVHAVDARRDVRFSDGGPPVWSVGVVACATRHPEFLFATYGLSRALSPDSPFEHELSMRVAHDTRDQPPLWPTLLLRHLARYELASERASTDGETLTFREPITRAAVPAEEAGEHPETAMQAIAFLRDPALGVVTTPVGPIEVRRVFGLLPDEIALASKGPAGAIVAAIARKDPSLTTNLARASYAGSL